MSADPAVATGVGVDSATTPVSTLLTVVVVAFVGDDCLPGCLNHLLPQTGRRANVDVVVVCDDRLVQRKRWQREYPQVRWLYMPGIVHPAAMRAKAVAKARGTHVAVLEDHCLAAPGWCDAAFTAVSEGRDLQGGPIDKAVPDSPLSWAGYWLEFAYYMPPISREGDRASDCNSIYSRSALESVADAWQEEFHETTVNRALRDHGVTIVRDPQQLVFERHPQKFVAALEQRLAFGRTYSETRVDRLTTSKRLALGVAAVLLPVLFTVRIGRIAATHHRLGAFIRSYPWFLLLASAWAIGEMHGYFSGPRASVRP